MTREELVGRGLAQQIVALGFSDKYITGPPVFRVSGGEGRDYEDILDCVDIIGSYNSFKPKKVKAALSALDTFRYRISIGRESSPVIYIGAICLDPEEFREFKEKNGSIPAADLKLYTDRMKEFENFNRACEKFAKATKATEFSFRVESVYRACRFWWD